ncbi:ergothioneine biosynthesis protein EgtB [Flagellimonas myxillae]|uniref:ergothioneine biosynthesis protein EgtB n=1 Tax=Flagellimonas myxillae TaxID=2942214 RepID=UPI00201F7AD7|nr:ergothioneine biosynthesis protein EgtB [Muricauda myxillae]MCL6268174.1 ergothioneine biosynthesis protein EgtB [Muricauda myxillae]
MLLIDSLLDFFLETRKASETICEPLEIEDYVVQPVVDVSPPKWHLGHTTWFFEEFILKPHAKGYKEFDADFSFVFNSYYEAVGKRVVRSDRGNLSRPSVNRVYAYREYVTEGIKALFSTSQEESLNALLEMGIHHEKQHQELLLTDIKYILGNNPLLPMYSDTFIDHPVETHTQDWIAMEEGIFSIGHNSDAFCYDNELGQHKVFLQPYKISNKLVTNGEFMDFIEAGAYQRFDLWHAEGWDWVNLQHIKAPLYWHQIEGEWWHYTTKGLQKVDNDKPITHISYFEAFAYAQWKGMRLPTEFEWEAAQEFFPWGKRWEWTESAYLPYPNYQKAEGALGEYNGKFMVNQKVLRGGSVATPAKHTRHTYRNFFHPQLRWQFTGLRLAQ